MRATCLSHLILLYLIMEIILGERFFNIHSHKIAKKQKLEVDRFRVSYSVFLPGIFDEEFVHFWVSSCYVLVLS